MTSRRFRSVVPAVASITIALIAAAIAIKSSAPSTASSAATDKGRSPSVPIVTTPASNARDVRRLLGNLPINTADGNARCLPGLRGCDSAEVFVGPFPSWANAKTDYGAKGDGAADDTAALQRALDELGQDGKKKVLYLPAGTYRISATLKLEKRVNVSILGEDPATTRVAWHGPRNPGPDYSGNVGVMLLGQNSAYVRLGRITLDGRGVANWATRWRWGSYASGDYFPTGLQIHDMVFQDADVGIGAGYAGNGWPQDTAEYSQVYRSKFLRCGYAGINTQDYNALLWGVRDSYFEDNAVGVRVQVGNANVYDSVFKRSTLADITAELAPFVSARGNYSFGSKRFFASTGNTGVVNLHSNTILDSVEAPVQPVNTNELVMIGNAIRTGSGVAVDFQGWGGLLSAGNRYSATSWIARNPGQTFLRSLDDVAGAEILTFEPQLPATPAKFAGPIVTAQAFTGAAVQQAIDAAQASNGRQPVVYLPTGTYPTAQTVTIPAESDVQLVGDGDNISRLIATAGNAVLQLNGPSRARVQDLSVHGGYGMIGDGLSITRADQAGGSIVMNSVNVTGPNTQALGVDIDGIDQTTVELIMPHYVGGRQGALRVSGGPMAASYADAAANVRVVDAFSGVGGNGAAFTYQVRNGGRLISLDQWAETSNRRFLQLDVAANVTVSGGSFGFDTRPPDNEPFIGAAGFSGRLSMVGLLFGNTVLATSGGNPNQNVLFASSRLDGWAAGAGSASKIIVANTAGTTKSYFNVGADIWFDTSPPNDGDVADAWLRGMLKQLRDDRSSRFAQPPAGATAVRITRFSVAQANTGIRITR